MTDILHYSIEDKYFLVCYSALNVISRWMIDWLLFNVKWKKFEDTKRVIISRDTNTNNKQQFIID